MSRLIQKAPESIWIEDVEYPINTNFREALISISALKKEDFTELEKCEILFHNLYLDFHEDRWTCEITPDFEKASLEAVKFLSCNKVDDKEETKEALCDFEQDGEYIYQSLLDKGIDLDKIDNMHWWTFLAHLAEIKETQYNRIVYLRHLYQTGKLFNKEHKEERKEAERIGWHIIKLKDEEKDSAIDSLSKILQSS